MDWRFGLALSLIGLAGAFWALARGADDPETESTDDDGENDPDATPIYVPVSPESQEESN